MGEPVSLDTLADLERRVVRLERESVSRRELADLVNTLQTGHPHGHFEVQRPSVLGRVAFAVGMGLTAYLFYRAGRAVLLAYQQ